MDGPIQDRSTEQENAAAAERRALETPEDVAVLYSWANLHGAKYRDFSASRREYRAQMRHRAAEQEAEAELQAKRDAEAAEAASTAEAAAVASTVAALAAQKEKETGEVQAVAIPQPNPRQEEIAIAATRQAAALAAAQAALQKAEREMVAARAAAQREEELYAARETQGNPVRAEEFKVTITDPYERSEREFETLEHTMHQPEVVNPIPPAPRHIPLQSNPVPTDRGAMPLSDVPPLHTHVVPEYPVYHPAAQAPPPGQAAYQQRPEYQQPMQPPPQMQVQPPQQEYHLPPVQRAPQQQPYPAYRPETVQQQAPVARPQQSYAAPMDSGMGYDSYSQVQSRTALPQPAPAMEYAPPIAPPPSARPAWFYADHDVQEQRPTLPTTPSPLADTLQHSRERVASRWFALKGVFDSSLEQEVQPLRHKEARTPALAMFSLAGGVGKTSMVATLGRALASLGEKVLLTDTTSYGLLPFYFGARELRPGVVRTFSPPSGSTDAPIYLVNYDVDKPGEQNPDWLAEEIIRNSRGTNRVLLDLGTGSASLMRRIARLSPTILVPVAPDMNSVIGLAHVEKSFAGQTDQEGRPIQPMYILNQFDASLPLHLDVREVMRQQLGDRLLPFVIRRSPSVSEALAEGMTVMDYAPGSPVAEDYMNLAGWLRSLSAPAAQAFRGVRWSER
ncbi:MAG TPA: cellulose synthase operon protein YhjQ/BcsQ [Acidobacteriaceae bacterium]